jgi:methionyl-tRNA synthetase
MEYVTYEQFKKMDMRVGQVVSVEAVEGADKLLKFQIDFGDVDEGGLKKLRQIVSGLKEFYPEYEKLIGKQLLYILNLEPRTIRGVESNGMLMAVDGKDGAPVFLIPEAEVMPGAKVR